MDVRTMGVDRIIHVERPRCDSPLHDFVAHERRAVRSYAPSHSLRMAELDEIDEPFLNVRFAAREFNVEFSEEPFQVENGLLPFLDGHLGPVVWQSPVLAVAALIITDLIHDTLHCY